MIIFYEKSMNYSPWLIFYENTNKKTIIHKTSGCEINGRLGAIGD